LLPRSVLPRPNFRCTQCIACQPHLILLIIHSQQPDKTQSSRRPKSNPHN
jgi:hypothetical protein